MNTRAKLFDRLSKLFFYGSINPLNRNLTLEEAKAAGSDIARLFNEALDDYDRGLFEEQSRRVTSYAAFRDAKRRVLENLTESGGGAPLVEIVRETGLPFDLTSEVIENLATEGKVTIRSEEGVKWVMKVKGGG